MLEIRNAVRTDAIDILAMIGELADFEHLRSQVIGTVADLERDLFGEQPYARALIAQWQGQTAAFALYFFNYSTFLCRPGLFLEDLFVRPAYRRHGIGQALLQQLESLARAAGCGRFEWSVLDWNQRAIDFYERYGARPNGGWTAYRKSLL